MYNTKFLPTSFVIGCLAVLPSLLATTSNKAVACGQYCTTDSDCPWYDPCGICHNNSSGDNPDPPYKCELLDERTAVLNGQYGPAKAAAARARFGL